MGKRAWKRRGEEMGFIAEKKEGCPGMPVWILPQAKLKKWTLVKKMAKQFLIIKKYNRNQRR